MKKNSTVKRILYASVFILLFFFGLQLIPYFKIDSIPIGIIVELITIPILIALPILLFIVIRNWKREKWKLRSSYAISFALLMITILLLIVVSF